MKQRWIGTTLMAVFVCLAGTIAQAQTTSVSGVVVDPDGRPVPGAAVVVKNVGTSTTYETVTSATGGFSIPAVTTGTYSVTVTLAGFKTAVLNNVVANVGGPATVTAKLEVGQLADTINVEAKSELLQTQSSAISTTVDVRQISNLPLTTRAALDFVTFLPGVSTPGGNRQSMVNGLPQSAINITLDGVNVQDNTLKGDRGSDGFFAIVNPRLDATEEVTVALAGSGAEASGQGGVQVKFVTRSGTNEFHGGLYHYLRKDEFNKPTWFNERNNIAKAALLQNQFGAYVGGPIKIPGLFNGRDRAFFFLNMEEVRQPSDTTRNRTILSPSAQAGIFRYTAAGQTREVNLFQLAAANGQLSVADPTLAKIFSDIRAATGTTGAVIDLPDPAFQRYSYNVPVQSKRRYPTGRIDVDITAKHRATVSSNYQWFADTPDTLNNRDAQFPGFPAYGGQGSERLQVTGSLRSTIRQNVVNELRIGGSGAPVKFFAEQNVGMWNGTSVADQGGFHLNFGQAPLSITNAAAAPAPQARNAYTRLVENTVNWLKGSHSITLGGSFTSIGFWQKNSDLVPTVTFDIVSGDPADAMFSNPASFPGASTAQLNVARRLYAVLTGRVGAVTGNAGLSEDTGNYTYMGDRFARANLKDYGVFFQDNWRIRPSLSLNLGLRYEVQTPFEAGNNSYSFGTLGDAWGVSGLKSGCDVSHVTLETCNLFQAGTLQGAKPVFQQFKKGVKSFNTDLNNLAPSVGFNWQPSPGGFLAKLLGRSGDSVIRGGFARSYSRAGLTDFTTPLGANPGLQIPVSRTAALGNLAPLPLLFRDRARLSPPTFSEKPNYPMTDPVDQDINVFDPNLKTPYSDSWSIGIQRQISKNFAVDVRYVGTRSRDLWRVYNLNEINFIENGFLNEFRLAQQNLAANIAAGRGNTFAYTGAPGTSPLPIFLAYLNGGARANAGDPSRYTSGAFSDNTFVPSLARFNPNPRAAADALDADATRRSNALNAGLPANFLVANPDLLGGANVTGNGSGTNYHGLQIELRRRYAKGFSFAGSYALGRATEREFYGFRHGFRSRLDAANQRVDPTTGITVGATGEGGVTHALKGYWSIELPFGNGKKFLGDASGVLERIVGGWQLHGGMRLQTGQLIDIGNVRMVGFDKKEAQKMFKLRTADQAAGTFPTQRVFMFPQSVIDETVKAFSVSPTSATGYGALGAPSGKYFAPANGPDCIETAGDNNFADTDHLGFGDCGVHSLVLTGPMFKNVDLSLTKFIKLAGRTRLEFRLEALNVFNKPNFVPVVGVSATPTNFEVTQLTGANTSRTVQIVSRFTW